MNHLVGKNWDFHSAVTHVTLVLALMFPFEI